MFLGKDGPVLGVETIGNATIIAYDDAPLIATDPWICGDPYFGSWTLSHEIPVAQLDSILRCKYVWFSHAHPDHLNSDSLEKLTGHTILLPDHVGGRVARDLRSNKLTVQVLKDAEWFELSPHVKVMSVSDYNQDGTLLLQVGDALFINLNDGSARGWRHFIRRLAGKFRNTYVLALRNYGDADMVNIYDEQGHFIPPPGSAKRPLGPEYGRLLKRYGAKYALPFSCFHRYQRTDTQQAAQYETPMEAHFANFDNRWGELLPAFSRIDVVSGNVRTIDPAVRTVVPRDPSEFGDDWSDPLQQAEIDEAARYFQRKEKLRDHLGFIELRVGGRENRILLNSQIKKCGITFEAPRRSLTTAIRYEVFDDLLIGNFMKTTLHEIPSLYPKFSPIVAKYADNGQAQSKEEVAEYFAAYRKRASFDYLFERAEHHAEGIFRSFVNPQSRAFKLVRQMFREA